MHSMIKMCIETDQFRICHRMDTFSLAINWLLDILENVRKGSWIDNGVNLTVSTCYTFPWWLNPIYEASIVNLAYQPLFTPAMSDNGLIKDNDHVRSRIIISASFFDSTGTILGTENMWHLNFKLINPWVGAFEGFPGIPRANRLRWEALGCKFGLWI